jgi:uncharacterized protein YndB with AHSA1/START domain
MNGDLVQAGDRWQLRFERRVAHPPEKVWRAITEPEHLAAWFPHEIVGDWEVGAPLEFKSRYGDFDGEVLAYEPPRLVEFRWGTDTIRMEVEADGDGAILTLTDTIEELGKAARDSAGWHTCLDRLEHDLDGTEADWEDGSRWKELNAGYTEKYGPEAATIGPPAPIEE